MKKFAFTLAEALITLAIIGVIAAITIPSIVANHQKKALETQFAKAYRTLMQAVNLAVAEHGGISVWDWKSEYTNEEKDAFVKKYFVPYLNVIKYCNAGNSESECPNEAYTRPRLILADGSGVSFDISGKCLKNKSSRCLGFDIDTNGTKKPNKKGYDKFGFSFFAQTSEFMPVGAYNKFDETTGKFTKYTYDEVVSNCAQNGWHCTARIILDGFKINY